MDFLPLKDICYNRLVRIQYNVGLEIDILRREMQQFQQSNDINRLLFEVLLCDVRTQMMMLAFVQSVYKKKGATNPLFDYEALEYIRQVDKSDYEKFDFIHEINDYLEKCEIAFHQFKQEITPIIQQFEQQFPDYNKIVSEVMSTFIDDYPYGITMVIMNKMYFEGLDYKTECIAKQMYEVDKSSNTLKAFDTVTNKIMEPFAL